MKFSTVSGICGLVCLASGWGAQTNVVSGLVEPPVLKGVAQVRRLSQAEAAKALPVTVRGVVTWVQLSDRRAFVIRDENDGIRVSLSEQNGRPDSVPKPEWGDFLRVGNEVEVVGVTDATPYSPRIVPVTVRPLGTAPLPPPRPLGLQGFRTGSLDCQWLQVFGVVVDVRPIRGSGEIDLTLLTAHGPIIARVPKAAGIDIASLREARVRVTGCGFALHNARSELVGLRIDVPGPDHLMVMQPAPADLFEVRPVDLSRLRGFMHEGETLHRVKTRGVLLAQRPGSHLWLHDGGRSVKVRSTTAERFVPGDVIEASGFVNYRTVVGSLERAVVRKVAEDAAPLPLAVTLDRIFASGGNALGDPGVEDFDGKLVQFEGEIVQVDRIGEDTAEERLGQELHLVFSRIKSPGLSRAIIPLRAGESIPRALARGASVRVTCVADPVYAEDSIPLARYPRPSGARFLARSLADVTVLHAAPWWTAERASMAAWLIGFATVGTALWIALLRRQLARRTLEVQRAAAQSGALAERQRISRELHDSLEQGLAGVSMQLDGLARRPNAVAAGSVGDFVRARAMLAHVRAEARHSVWELRSEFLREDGLRGALKKLTALGTPQCPVHVEIVGPPCDLSQRVEINLLRIAQEAVGNALRHGAPARVDVRLEFAPGRISLSIKDDGRGFDPAAKPEADLHFGLIGIRERARILRAELCIDSAPGQGALVVVVLKPEPKTEI